MQIEQIESLHEVSAEEWNALNASGHPFTCYQFLRALEDSKSIEADTGWYSKHLLFRDEGRLVAALPCYEKHHSYGEYVFDWSWAQAYARAGLEYFPKLVCAIPFTPVPGPRLLCLPNESENNLWQAAREALTTICIEDDYSGWHLLFSDQTGAATALAEHMLERTDVQFHWINRDYRDYDEFLSTLRSSKRKQLRRERRRVQEQGVQLRRYSGEQITEQVLDCFYLCYCETYLRRSGHRGYLTRAFFEQIVADMSDQIMIVVAEHEGHEIASALFFFDQHHLYGRYWGALQDIDCLHFEVCYYQGIEFAIERGLSCFNPGTQGEHKLVRGFEPRQTQSRHWVSDERFRPALEQFLEEERDYKEQYQQAAADALPFRRIDDSS